VATTATTTMMIVPMAPQPFFAGAGRLGDVSPTISAARYGL
jgi:hypothetical protein